MKLNIVRNSLLVILISGSIFFNSCDSGINLFTKSDDVQLGRDIDAEIRNNPQEYPVFRGDPSIKNYINLRIFQHVLASPKIESKNIYPYQLEIIDQDILNAFALPGGYIYIYTGLLKYLDSEAALAGAIGHEIAHAEKRHATQRLTSYYGVSILLSFLLGNNPSKIAEIGANLFVGLAFLANSRSDENESDQESFEYLRDTRYYAGGVKFFFEKMRDDGLVSSKSDKVATFLSTHPDPIDRISSTNQRLTKAGLPVFDYKSTGDGVFKNEYLSNIKSKLP
jgi:beta-barrel assembly-enhancing protease